MSFHSPWVAEIFSFAVVGDGSFSAGPAQSRNAALPLRRKCDGADVREMPFPMPIPGFIAKGDHCGIEALAAKP